MSFRKYVNRIQEETTAGDIATVMTKLDMTRRSKHLHKGKKCKAHSNYNCEECEELEESKFR